MRMQNKWMSSFVLVATFALSVSTGGRASCVQEIPDPAPEYCANKIPPCTGGCLTVTRVPLPAFCSGKGKGCAEPKKKIKITITTTRSKCILNISNECSCDVLNQVSTVVPIMVTNAVGKKC